MSVTAPSIITPFVPSDGGRNPARFRERGSRCDREIYNDSAEDVAAFGIDASLAHPLNSVANPYRDGQSRP
jgi:hypothetical protein